MDVVRNKRSYTVKFYLIEFEPDNYHIYIKGKLQGYPLNIIIDTGASHTCFDLDFFKKIDPEALLVSNNGTNVGIGTDQFDTAITSIRNFKISRYKIPDFQAILLSMNHINNIYATAGFPQIDAILGSDFFVTYQAIIDYSTQKLTFQI